MFPRMPQRGARLAAPCVLLFLSFAAASAGEGPAPLPRKAIPSDSRWRSLPPRWDFWNPTSGEPEWGQRRAEAKVIESHDARIPHVNLGPSLANPEAMKKFLLSNHDRVPAPPSPWIEDDQMSAPEVGLGLSTLPAVLPMGFRQWESNETRAHDMIAAENAKGVDRFAKQLFRRTDLQGLPARLTPDCGLPESKAERLDRAVLIVHRHFQDSLLGGDKSTKKQWAEYEAELRKETQNNKAPFESEESRIAARIAALMQIMSPESEELRRGLIRHLKGLSHPDAALSLAKLAIFSEEPALRAEATTALKSRPGTHYDEAIRLGLRYPRPEVAVRTMDLIVKTRRMDWADALVDLIEGPDPRAPKATEDGKSQLVRELVKIRHEDNCMLCHPPARRGSHDMLTMQLTGLWQEYMATPRKQIPNSNGGQFGFGGYGLGIAGFNRSGFQEGPSVRFDVTFLRQDFSLKLPVASEEQGVSTAGTTAMKRFDFLVRTRKLTAAQTRQYEKELARFSGENSPYRTVAVFALRQLTKQDVEPTAEAWRAVLAELR